MNLNQIMTATTTLSLLILPLVTSANTYQYVNTSGNLQTIEASTPGAAISNASNIAYNSGVIAGTISAIGGSYEPVTNSSGSNLYQFVDMQGNVKSIYANSASLAIANAVNIALHSGVILVTSSTMITN